MCVDCVLNICIYVTVYCRSFVSNGFRVHAFCTRPHCDCRLGTMRLREQIIGLRATQTTYPTNPDTRHDTQTHIKGQCVTDRECNAANAAHWLHIAPLPLPTGDYRLRRRRRRAECRAEWCRKLKWDFMQNICKMKDRFSGQNA